MDRGIEMSRHRIEDIIQKPSAWGGRSDGFSHEEYAKLRKAGYDDREIKQWLEANPEARVGNNNKHNPWKRGSQQQSKTDFRGGGGWYDTMLKGAAALDAKDEAHQARLDKIRSRKGKGIDSQETDKKASETSHVPGSDYEQKFNEAFQKYQKEYDPAKQESFNNNIQFKRTHSGQSKLVNQANRNAFRSGNSVDIYKNSRRMAGDAFRPERHKRSSERRKFES